MNRNIVEQQKKFIFEYMKLGYSNKEIAAEDESGELTAQIVKDRRKAILDAGLMTREEDEKLKEEHAKIQLAQKHEEETELIRAYVIQGLTIKEVAERLNCGTAHVSKLIRADKEKGNTDWPDLKEKNDIRASQKTLDEREYVLQEMKKGKTPLEISDDKSTFDLTYNRVKKIRKQLIERNLITADEYAKKIKTSSNKKMRSAHLQDAEEIIELRKQGLSDYEISVELSCGRNYISNVIKEYKEFIKGKEEKQKFEASLNDKNDLEKRVEGRRKSLEIRRENKLKKEELEKKLEEERIKKEQELERKRIEEEKERKRQEEIKKAEEALLKEQARKEAEKRAVSKKSLINRIKEEQKAAALKEKLAEVEKSEKRYQSNGKIIIEIPRKVEKLDEKKAAEKLEKQRKYEEIANRRSAEKQRKIEEARLRDEHSLHVKAEADRLSTDTVINKYETVWKEANRENLREEKGMEDIPVTSRKKFFEIVEIADSKQVLMKNKYYKLLENVLLYHPEMANENILHIYLKNTLKLNNITGENMGVLKEKVEDLVYTYSDTKHGKKLKELNEYIDKMSIRRDGWYFISNKINEREEK